MIERSFGWQGELGTMRRLIDPITEHTIGGYANPCTGVLWSRVPLPLSFLPAPNGSAFYGNVMHGRGHWQFNERHEWVQILTRR